MGRGHFNDGRITFRSSHGVEALGGNLHGVKALGESQISNGQKFSVHQSFIVFTIHIVSDSQFRSAFNDRFPGG